MFTREDIPSVHADMTRAANGRHAWMMGGGDLAAQFADAGVLDDLLVAIAPVALGRGAPLLPRRLEDVVRNGDVACLHYTVGDRR